VKTFRASGRYSTAQLGRAALALAMVLAIAPAHAQQDACGDLCDSEIVVNANLAGCFLAEYDKLAAQDGPAVAVDLSACPADRGVVKSLPMPGQAATDEPDVTFVVSKTKLECLKKKLQEPGVVLDPTARISLTAC